MTSLVMLVQDRFLLNLSSTFLPTEYSTWALFYSWMKLALDDNSPKTFHVHCTCMTQIHQVFSAQHAAPHRDCISTARYECLLSTLDYVVKTGLLIPVTTHSLQFLNASIMIQWCAYSHPWSQIVFFSLIHIQCVIKSIPFLKHT